MGGEPMIINNEHYTLRCELTDTVSEYEYANKVVWFDSEHSVLQHPFDDSEPSHPIDVNKNNTVPLDYIHLMW